MAMEYKLSQTEIYIKETITMASLMVPESIYGQTEQIIKENLKMA